MRSPDSPASADSYYLSAFDESLTKNLDIVFMDQRGTGAVHGLKCPVAQVRFDTADLALHAPEKAVAAAKAYAQDCVAELKAGDFLGHLGTVDAVDDAEDFRQAIGAPKVLALWRELRNPVCPDLCHPVSASPARRHPRWGC